MRAISLTAPWAHLTVLRELGRPRHWPALKPIETRSWYVNPDKLPMRLAIHASKGITGIERAHITHDRNGRRIFRDPYAHALELAGMSIEEPWTSKRGDRLPLGAIIGVVTLFLIRPSDEVTAMWKRGDCSDRVYKLGNFAPGRFAWYFRDPVRLLDPIPIAGAQGLWKVPAPIACDIAALDPYQSTAGAA